MTADTIPLRFWISETLDRFLADLESESACSRSECVRALFAHYLYGTHGATRPRDATAARVVKRGCWGGRTPDLGKNCVDVKLWLAPAMRDDLARLAQRAGLTLSHFAREVVVTHLLGHSYLPLRAELFAARTAPDDALQQE